MNGLVLLLLLLLSAVPGSLSDRDIDEVIEALEHENPAVRVEAVVELGDRKDRRALAPLLGCLDDPQAIVRAHAAEALRSLGDERAVPRLSRALADPDPTTRCRVVLALGDLAGKYEVPALTPMLGDPAVVVRAATVRALGEIGDPLSLDIVLEAQRTERVDTDHAVTAAALVAAAKLGGPGGLDRSLAIAGGKVGASWFLRAVEARAIGLAGDERKIPRLVSLLGGDADARVAEAAAGSLARLGRIERLVTAMRSEVVFRRRAAVAALAEAKGEAARAALFRATGDEDPGVVFEAATALLARGEAEAFPILIELLSSEAPVWLGAVKVLEERTGFDWGRNPPRYKDWWRTHRGRLRFDPETGRYGAAR